MEESEQSIESLGHHSKKVKDLLTATENQPSKGIKEADQDAFKYGLVSEMSVEMDDLLGKYVVINYESVPYLEYALNIENSYEIYIVFMQRDGRTR